MDKDADGTKFYPSSLLKDNFRDSCDSLELLSGILPQYKDDITATARPKPMVQIQWVIGPQATGIIKQVINIVGKTLLSVAMLAITNCKPDMFTHRYRLHNQRCTMSSGFLQLYSPHGLSG